MRDLLIVGLVLLSCVAALRRPWLGALAWAWLSLMSPHRYTYGFAQSFPVTALVAVATLLGMLATRDRWSPLRGGVVWIFVAFNCWLTISWLAGPDIEGQYDQWSKIMKINLMVLVSMSIIRSRFQINCFVTVCALSLGILGAKGGLFTLMTGGNYRVWGPPGTFAGGNNEFALALVTVIPLIRYMQLQMDSRWQRHVMLLLMLLCGAAALGSHSRGALLAGATMGLMLWWRGSRNRLTSGLAMAVLVMAALSFMPAHWFERMETIETYDEDRSAMGRFAAWSLAWNSAFHNFTGLGLNAAVSDYFVKYSAYGLEYGTPVAHSIYFQVLGHHGFIGLALWLSIWVGAWRYAAVLRRIGRAEPRAAWSADLGALVQTSLAGFLVGGAFLSLAYYDLIYNVLAIVVLARWWVDRQAWKTEPEPPPLSWDMWRRPRPASVKT
ncbi:putative O-glycosylation ligase, exosortase A system-associated [Ideonella sp. DXS22W]|uniref:O-glycosylation ligase, exosortase A system-associated n=1 Tax=Pseudaquabacterium inlustre TaxID=2984192 RepID=A0ABU9CNG2_9BURK